MYPRTEYEMSHEDYDELIAAMKPMPEMLIGGVSTSSFCQNSANAEWERLGVKMGFDWMTVRPISGKGSRLFSAIPSETEEALIERLIRADADKRQRDIAKLREEVAERQAKLAALDAA